MSNPSLLDPAAGEPVPDVAPAPEPPPDALPPLGDQLPDAALRASVDGDQGSAPAPHPRPSYGFLSVVALITLVADLGTKHWAETHLMLGQTPAPRSIIKGVMSFMLAKNKGGAWGLLQTSAEHFRKYFFVCVSVVAIVFIVSLYRRLNQAQSALRWGLPLVLGGALGNLVDRIRYGYVIDFIDVEAIWSNHTHHWPTFNVADIAICVGVGLMAFDMLSTPRLAIIPRSEVTPSPDDAFAASPAGAPAEEPPHGLP